MIQSVATATDIARGGGGSSCLIRGLALLGVIYHDLGQIEQARAQFARARELGDRPVARRALWQAEHWLEVGEIERARASTAGNLLACQELGWAGHAAHCHALLGEIAASQGDLAAAGEHLARARSWTRATGEVEMVLRCQSLTAFIALVDNRPEDSMREAGAGLHLAETAGANWFSPRLAIVAGRAALSAGQPSRALALAERASVSENTWRQADARQLAGLITAAIAERGRQ